MKEKVMGSIGVVFLVGLIMFVMALVMGGILKLLGVESTSKGMLILFLIVAIVIGLVLEPIVAGICKGLAEAINVPLKTAFVGYLILGFIVDMLIFTGVDYLFTSVWLPTYAVIIFSVLGTILEIILERKEKEWQ